MLGNAEDGNEIGEGLVRSGIIEKIHFLIDKTLSSPADPQWSQIYVTNFLSSIKNIASSDFGSFYPASR